MSVHTGQEEAHSQVGTHAFEGRGKRQVQVIPTAAKSRHSARGAGLPEWTLKMSTVWAWLASARIPGLAEVQMQDGSQN